MGKKKGGGRAQGTGVKVPEADAGPAGANSSSPKEEAKDQQLVGKSGGKAVLVEKERDILKSQVSKLHGEVAALESDRKDLISARALLVNRVQQLESRVGDGAAETGRLQGENRALRLALVGAVVGVGMYYLQHQKR